MCFHRCAENQRNINAHAQSIIVSPMLSPAKKKKRANATAFFGCSSPFPPSLSYPSINASGGCAVSLDVASTTCAPSLCWHTFGMAVAVLLLWLVLLPTKNRCNGNLFPFRETGQVEASKEASEKQGRRTAKLKQQDQDHSGHIAWYECTVLSICLCMSPCKGGGAK